MKVSKIKFQKASSKSLGRTFRVLGGSIIVFALLFAIGYILPENEAVSNVKSGNWELTCQFSDGWRTIPKDKVVDLDDVSGTWIFTNGSAKHCEITK